MNSNRKVILYANIENDARFEMTRHIGTILRESGWQVALCPAFVDEITDLTPPPDYTFSELKTELVEAEIIIPIGGDGTILRAARATADIGVPILGVNMGGKGFMAELEITDIGLLKTVASSDYKIETRMMIDVEAQRNGEIIYSDFALNDIVVKGDNKVVDMTIFADGERITHFSGDGTVLATPTGSTAYSLSAGGPIVEPTAKNIIITPICAHILEAKTFVLVASRVVTIDLSCRKNTPAYMSADGGDHTNLICGDTIKVYRSQKLTQLVRLSDKSFYSKITSKLISR